VKILCLVTLLTTNRINFSAVTANGHPVIRVEIEEVDQLNDSPRGLGGFGSTGMIVQK
jgi:dUTPase